MRPLLILILALSCATAHASELTTAMRSPLSYSLQQYGLVLGVSILSAVVRWVMRLRAGLVPSGMVAALVGEACISVFVGLVVFWLCAWQELPELLTIALVALAGNMGSRALVLMERIGDRLLAKRLAAVGIRWPEVASKPAPLDDAKGPAP